MSSKFLSHLNIKLGLCTLCLLGAAYGCGSDSDDSNAGNGDTGGSSGEAGSGSGQGGSSGGSGTTGTGGSSGSSGTTGEGGDTGDAGMGGEPGTGGTSGTDVGGAGGEPGTLDPVLVVDLSLTSLLPGEQEFIAVRALDDQGRNDTLEVTTSDDAVATGSVLGGTLVIQAGDTVGIATITVTSGSGLRKTVEVINSDPRAMKVGNDLLVAFVHEFDLQWNDAGSDADANSGYWKPRLKNGFHTVGYYGVEGYGNPSAGAMMVVVKALAADALAVPEDYDKLWETNVADVPAAFWQPICPINYKALGTVIAGLTKPTGDDVIRCVRSDLAEIAAIGAQIWNDDGSGNAFDLSTWHVTVPEGADSIGTMPVAAGTFLGVRGYAAPTSHEVANILRLDLPIVREVDLGTVYPKLDSLLPPEDTTPVQLGRSIYIPFFGVNDPARTFEYKITKSPFYRLDRDVYFRRLIHQYNQTNVDQPISHAVTTGVSVARTEEFSIETGIEISVSGGVNFIGSAETTVTVSLKLGYTSSTTLSEFREEEVTKEVTVPPHSAAALWQLIHRFTLKRRNGNAWETVGTPWEIGVNSFVVDQYPD